MNADYEKKNGIQRIVAFVREDEAFELSTNGAKIIVPNAMHSMQLSPSASTSAMGGIDTPSDLSLTDTPPINESVIVD